MEEDEPAAAYKPRRPHKKSRNGCLRCKERKTKCDEASPSCSRCAKGGLDCIYPTPKASNSTSKSETDSSSLASTQQQQRQEQHILQHTDFQDAIRTSVVQNYNFITSSPSAACTPPLCLQNFDFLSPTVSNSSNSLDFLQSPYDEHQHHQQRITRSRSQEMLDWTDLELLSYYLNNTSSALSFDGYDLFALCVGMPNLAFSSKPLMSSIVALGAVHKAYQLLLEDLDRDQDSTSSSNNSQDQDADQTMTVSSDCREQVFQLLDLAEQRHDAAVAQVQLDIPHTQKYDWILAITPLMVMYASATHCLRIRLAETQTPFDSLPIRSLPAQSQWISLIRAAHMAFAGLLNDDSLLNASMNASRLNDGPESLPTPPEGGYHPIPATTDLPPAYHIDSPSTAAEDGPTPQTRTLLLPILAASSPQALRSLRARARAFTKLEDKSISPQLQMCLDALQVLSNIMAEVFSSSSGASENSPDTFSSASSPHSPDTGKSRSATSKAQPEFPSIGGLSNVSPWLRSYVVRVTSDSSTTVTPGTATVTTNSPASQNKSPGRSEKIAPQTPTRPLRRVIMAFLNRVPAEFLVFVQDMLDYIGLEPVLKPSYIPVPVDMDMDMDMEMLGIWQPEAIAEKSFGETAKNSSFDVNANVNMNVNLETSPNARPTMAQRLAIDIFAHWIVLVGLLDGVWWIGGIGAWELERVVAMVRARGWISGVGDGDGSAMGWWPERMSVVGRELRSLRRGE